jgi:hypothetical protein
MDKARQYFKLRDKVWEDSQGGHTKVEIHEMAKQQILPLLTDEDDNFLYPIDLSQPLSTKSLSDRGWDQFIEHFKATFIYV